VSEWSLVDEQAQVAFGQQFAQAIKQGALVFLHGNLGAGKTTFVRGVIQGLGHQGNVKSPTYTLIEPYEHIAPATYHLDLYRLGDPEELEFLGLREMLADESLMLIEWPERAGDWLPVADIECFLTYQEPGRQICLQANTDKGREILSRLSA
jgi:tRNA threonylcarbamoyladenosine biosynthesis protein TsaE